ncbi:MAG TPA: type IV pilus assembly protein PilM [Gemmataceae bacterium]|jgi:type IV pilus assembly protein PilM|nr:type IV pilus assembly protein PilM [Gemmataceae bacterium]
MPVQPGVWGIDLGQCALKAVRVEQIDGQVTATAFDYVEHPKILSQPDADPDQLTREALEKFLSRNSLKGDLVAISIPGQSGLARFVKLPPVEEKKINDIVRFEAKQQIPFNLEEVVWDYQKLSSGVVTDGFAMETEIGLFAIKRDTVNRYLQHFKDVNVEVQIVQMAPLALCNFVSYDLLEKAAPAEGEETGGKKRCVVALDIGADNTNLVITDGHRIIWQRPIPLGGNHFTRALTKDMKLTFAKAEHLKRNATKSPELKQILSSLKPVLNDFVGEVQRSLGYFTNTHRDAAIQYMIGLGSAFRLPGLQKFLSEKLQLDVRKLQKLERLAGDEVVTAPVFSENVLSFAVAYGLSLQGLHAARLHTNLLPQEIRVERLIRAKKPWAVTAAASLLIGTAMLAIGYNRQFVAVASPLVKEKMKKVDEVDSKSRKFASDVVTVQQSIEAHKAAVKSIVIGQDEKLNWILFNSFVNRALPKPDGSNLNTVPTKPDTISAKDIYWKYNGQLAYQKFLAQQRGTAKALDKVDEDDWRDDLVQANVESMYCIYCPNLAAYYANLKADPEARHDTMTDKDFKTPPEGGGWVVELRGYTYHRGRLKFVRKAVVENLQRLPIRVAQDKPATPDGAQTGAPDQATPPVAATPAATPPAQPAGAAGATGAAEGDKKDNLNEVSHVVLFRLRSDEKFDPMGFQLISGRFADSLVGGGGGAAGMMPGMPGQAAGQGGAGETKVTGGSAVSWSPLGSEGSGGSASSGGTMGMPGFGGPRGGQRQGGGGVNPDKFMKMMQPSMGGQGNTMRPPTGFGGPDSTGMLGGAEPDEGKKKKGVHTRTEFVILFVWKEPLSAELLSKEEGAAAAPAPSGIGLGGMNMGGAR